MAGADLFRKLFGRERVEPAAPPPVPPQPPFDFEDDRIPDAARERVATIRAQLAELETRAVQRASAQELAELRQIGVQYLPVLLQSYIDIPAAHRAEIYRQTGRSASYALCDRLDTIVDRLRELSSQLAQEDLDAFHRNMRFIDTRFGKSPFDL